MKELNEALGQRPVSAYPDRGRLTGFGQRHASIDHHRESVGRAVKDSALVLPFSGRDVGTVVGDPRGITIFAEPKSEGGTQLSAAGRSSIARNESSKDTPLIERPGSRKRARAQHRPGCGQLYASKGTQVLIWGRNAKALSAAVQVIGHHAIGFEGDVADVSHHVRVADEIARRLSALDIYVANAGTKKTSTCFVAFAHPS